MRRTPQVSIALTLLAATCGADDPDDALAGDAAAPDSAVDSANPADTDGLPDGAALDLVMDRAGGSGSADWPVVPLLVTPMALRRSGGTMHYFVKGPG
jgi:hypothetical protein